MRKRLTLVLLGAAVAGAAYAQNFTVVNTDKAKALIEATIEAHGGSPLGTDNIIPKAMARDLAPRLEALVAEQGVLDWMDGER